MNKRLIIYSTFIVLLLPVMFQGPHDDLTLRHYITRCAMPLTLVAVFWINYQWLAPRIFKDGVGDMRCYVATNAVVVLISCIALGVWHHVEMSTFHVPRIEARDGMRPKSFYAFAALRDALNLLLAIIIAYTMRINQHIENLRRRQQEAEVARREAELRGLRSQISPHFLLNTLNNIYALSALSPERTQGAVMQLSHMLRHMLYDNQSEMVTLQSEADFIQSYVDLMKLRLSSNVAIETHIDVSPRSHTLVAPLLFISLVENAFKHGVSPAQPCCISITLSESPGSVTCSITNSNHPKPSADRSGHGIGLANVRQRLDMMYPDRYQWTKGVTPDGMYTSEIVLQV